MPQRQAIGVDVGGTNLRVARVDADGRILEAASERVSRNGAMATDRILALCAALCADAVVGAGVGIPGRVDFHGRRILSGGFLNLADVDLRQRLSAHIDRPVIVDTDSNMALIAEAARGAAVGYSDIAMLTIGTGIGGAIMLADEIVRGRMCAGQLGHLTVETDGLPCACGRSGCVETTSSGSALARLIAEAGLPPNTRIEPLIERAGAGDATAAAIVDAWARPLRAAIDSIVATVDPGIVVLGGGLGAAACRALERSPARSPWFRYPVAAAALGDDAGVIGAAFAAMRAMS